MLSKVNTEKEQKAQTKKDSENKGEILQKSEKEKVKPESEKESKSGNKRQSFISDFAALEKTYKILGLSKDPPKEEDTKAPVKKRHNSEGKTKNRKSTVLSDAEPLNTKEDSPPKEVKIDALDKGRAIAKRSFFQDLINEKKGVVKKDSELLGPQLRKKGSLTNAFEQGN